MKTRSKQDQILDEAESMIRLGGFHAFSFRDIAREVNLKSASVHYHFPTKEDLGAAVMKRYGARALAVLETVFEKHPTDWEANVREFADLFTSALERDGKLCLCGMLAAEYAMLPTAVVVELNDFAEKNLRWLEEVLLKGSWTEDKTEARHGAHLVFSTLEGAMMISLSSGKRTILSEVIALMIVCLRSRQELAKKPVAS